MVNSEDTAFLNDADGIAQIVYIILRGDKFRSFNDLKFAYYKAKRNFHSFLSGETVACADDFEISYTLRHDLQKNL